MNLSAASTATGASATEGDVKSYLTNLHDYIDALLGSDSTNKSGILALLSAPLNSKLSKTAAYTIVAADRGKVINCTGSGGWDLTITAAATLGDGFVFAAVNRTTGAITINPNLAEQVAGATTYAMQPGESVIVYCTGSAFELFGNSPKRSDVQTFTSSGTWIKPPAAPTNALVIVETWAGGGSGGKGTTDKAGGGGGGGEYACDIYPLSAFGSTETVTIGAGGTAVTASLTNGNAGGNTSVGSLAIAYGGGAGGKGAGNAPASPGGGGGGGGGDVSGGTNGLGADGGLRATAPGGLGEIGGTRNATTPAAGINAGGGGGGGGSATSNDGAAGGNTLKGGAGGGGGGRSTGDQAGPGGTSNYGGNGGAGSVDSTAATAGVTPSGGGGGSENGTSGAGGNGKAIVTVIW
jgi:hypothetical protein